MESHTAMSTAVAEPTSSSSSPGDDVMKILADVEGQLSRLRAAQKTQDEALISLADRAKILRDAEQQVQATRQELAQERDALLAQHSQLRQQQDQVARERAELQREQSTVKSQSQSLEEKAAQLQQSRQQWEQQVRLHEQQLESRQAEIERRSAELARAQSALESEQRRVNALRDDCIAQQQQFEQRTRAMEKEHAELLRRVEQAERNVGTLIEQAETTNRELQSKADQLKRSLQDVQQLRTQAAELEVQIKQATTRAEKAEHEAAELARLADNERQSVEKKLAAAESQLKKSQSAREAAEKQVQALREKAVELETSASTLQQQLQERTRQLSDSQSKLETAGTKLTEFAKILAEQTPQLERGSAALAMVQEQQQQIDSLTNQLAEMKLVSDPEEIKRRDDRINQLTEALRQARGQSAGQAGIAELERCNAELTQQVGQLKLELENAQVVAHQMRQQLEERVDASASPLVQDAALAEHAAKIAALTAEIERLQTQAADELQTQLKAQANAHKKELDKARGKAHQGDDKKVERLQKRVAELEAALQEARAAAAKPSGKASGKADEEQFAQKLREKAERITTVADHLRRRKERLKKLQALLHLRARQGGGRIDGSTSDEVLRLEQERLNLAETRRHLELMHKQVQRKSLRQRAVVSVTCIVLLALVCLGSGWISANTFSPAIRAASITLEARNQQRTPLTVEQAEEWRDWHTSLVRDVIFLSAVGKRLAERRLDQFASPSKLGQRLQSDLSMQSDQPGMMTLTLVGTDAEEAAAILDVLGTTIAMESNRQLSKRSDNSPAVLLGERREEDGRIRYATISPVAVKDVRLNVALPVAGALFALCLTSIIFVYIKLLRAKRSFEQDQAGLLLAS